MDELTIQIGNRVITARITGTHTASPGSARVGDDDGFEWTSWGRITCSPGRHRWRECDHMSHFASQGTSRGPLCRDECARCGNDRIPPEFFHEFSRVGPSRWDRELNLYP